MPISSEVGISFLAQPAPPTQSTQTPSQVLKVKGLGPKGQVAILPVPCKGTSMNASKVVKPAGPVKSAAADAAVATCNTVNAVSSTLNASVMAIGRVAKAADLKSDEWLFGVQSACAERREFIPALARLAVLSEVGAKLAAHAEAMLDPTFANSFKLADEMSQSFRKTA